MMRDTPMLRSESLPGLGPWSAVRDNDQPIMALLARRKGAHAADRIEKGLQKEDP